VLCSVQPSRQLGFAFCASANLPPRRRALIPLFTYLSATWRWIVTFGPLACSYLSRPDPFHQGVKLFLPQTGGALCLHRRGDCSGPLFLFADGTPLSRLHITDRLRSILVDAGVQGNFSSHSFRIGADTSANAAGLPDSLIRTLGRWSSDAYLVYPPGSPTAGLLDTVTVTH